MGRYEQYARGEFKKEAFRVELDATYEAKAVLTEALEQKAAYDKKYSIFRKLLSACDKRIALSEIIDYIDRIVVDDEEEIMI